MRSKCAKSCYVKCGALKVPTNFLLRPSAIWPFASVSLLSLLFDAPRSFPAFLFLLLSSPFSSCSVPVSEFLLVSALCLVPFRFRVSVFSSPAVLSLERRSMSVGRLLSLDVNCVGNSRKKLKKKNSLTFYLLQLTFFIRMFNIS